MQSPRQQSQGRKQRASWIPPLPPHPRICRCSSAASCKHTVTKKSLIGGSSCLERASLINWVGVFFYCMTLWCRSMLHIALRVCCCSQPGHADQQGGHHRFTPVSKIWHKIQVLTDPFSEIPASHSSCRTKKHLVPTLLLLQRGKAAQGRGQ